MPTERDAEQQAAGEQVAREQGADLIEHVTKHCGCRVRWAKTVPIALRARGEEVHEVSCHVYHLDGHADADRAFACRLPTAQSDAGEILVVLDREAHVSNPQAAVQAALGKHLDATGDRDDDT